MSLQTNKWWSALLKSALISMNSTKKKSHGYTPYRVMFGRESRYEDLLSTIDNLISTPQEDFEFEQSILEEFKLTEETIDMDIEDVFLPSSEQSLDEISLLDQETEER